MNNIKFQCKDWIYLWHKNNSASINPEDVKSGDMMYISMYDGLECDGYDGTVGKAGDFREKIYVEYQWEMGKTEVVEFEDENGDIDTCETMWVQIINVLGDADE